MDMVWKVETCEPIDECRNHWETLEEHTFTPGESLVTLMKMKNYITNPHKCLVLVLEIGDHSFDHGLSFIECIEIAIAIDSHENDYHNFDMVMEQYGGCTESNTLIQIINELKEWKYNGSVDSLLHDYIVMSGYDKDPYIILRHISSSEKYKLFNEFYERDYEKKYKDYYITDDKRVYVRIKGEK